MGGTFSRIKTWSSNEILTASDLNNEFDNLINNATPAGLDDASSNATAMQTTADPYPASAESLATSLEGELQRIRYVLQQITGKAYWYYDPTTTIEALATADTSALSMLTNVTNLKPVVNASANILDIFTKSGGADPDSTNYFSVAIPDGNGHTVRTRAASYLSGTSAITMADGTNYWGKDSTDGEIKTAWLYAIWDGTGIVWALGGYSGFTAVSTTTTATADDYLLLETSSTYTRNSAHRCVAVAKIRYEYDTGDSPDHTIQSSGANSPQVIWNPKSDYGHYETLAHSVTSLASISESSEVSSVVQQAGKYMIIGQATTNSTTAIAYGGAYIKTGNAVYGSATYRAKAYSMSSAANYPTTATIQAMAYLNSGDTIHLGVSCVAGSGTRSILGDDDAAGATSLTFFRID